MSKSVIVTTVAAAGERTAVASGLLTGKSALPVSQIRLADFDHSSEEGHHTLGKLKCYGHARNFCKYFL